MQLKKASRKQVKLKIGMFGPSGSGKTMSALKLAYGITNDRTKIAVIDTENGSAGLYSHLGEYNTLDLDAPYTPERYVQAIDACISAGVEVIIVDSISHEWEGPGGCLEVHSKMSGNSFTNRKIVGDRHKLLIDKILLSPIHFILCGRKKQEYAITEKDGKKVVEKMGLGVIQRDGLEYDLSIAFDLDIKHHATSSKDRTGLFIDTNPFIMNEETGKKLLDWSSEGEAYEEKKPAEVPTTEFARILAESKCEDIMDNCVKCYEKLDATEASKLVVTSASIKAQIEKADMFSDDQKKKFYDFIDLYCKAHK